jgi:gluconate 5-dehydrogenase
MAIEYSDREITANTICPGIFKTKMTDELLASKQVQKLINSQVLFKRPGKAKELGGLVVYLASDESSYMTGSVITIDGGWTCHL